MPGTGGDSAAWADSACKRSVETKRVDPAVRTYCSIPVPTHPPNTEDPPGSAAGPDRAHAYRPTLWRGRPSTRPSATPGSTMRSTAAYRPPARPWRRPCTTTVQHRATRVSCASPGAASGPLLDCPRHGRRPSRVQRRQHLLGQPQQQGREEPHGQAAHVRPFAAAPFGTSFGTDLEPSHLADLPSCLQRWVAASSCSSGHSAAS